MDSEDRIEFRVLASERRRRARTAMLSGGAALLDQAAPGRLAYPGQQCVRRFVPCLGCPVSEYVKHLRGGIWYSQPDQHLSRSAIARTLTSNHGGWDMIVLRGDHSRSAVGPVGGPCYTHMNPRSGWRAGMQAATVVAMRTHADKECTGLFPLFLPVVMTRRSPPAFPGTMMRGSTRQSLQPARFRGG